MRKQDGYSGNAGKLIKITAFPPPTLQVDSVTKPTLRARKLSFSALGSTIGLHPPPQCHDVLCLGFK
jgi:hypothetical protein